MRVIENAVLSELSIVTRPAYSAKQISTCGQLETLIAVQEVPGMAITLTQGELSAAIRLGDSAEEVAEATRLLGIRHRGDINATWPSGLRGLPQRPIVNEAGIRLAGYAFRYAPNAGRNLSFANAGRNSGAWTLLLPYRVHRAGSTGEAVAAAQEAVGTVEQSSHRCFAMIAVAATITLSPLTDGTTRDR